MTASDEEKKRLIRNAKKRQRYAEKKAQGGQTVKPRKVNGKKKDEKPIDTTQLNLIIASISSVIASRPNCEHWLLTEPEIQSITDPLSKMLAESETFGNLGQYSNQIALCMACITVFMPRMVISVQKSKEVKRIERTGQKTNTNVTDRRVGDTGKTKDSDIKPHNGNVPKSTANGSTDGESVPFYGVPIC